MLALITRGLSLGFTAGMLPGPLQAYIIQTALTFGWRKSLIVALSPLITDAPIIVLILFVLSQFPPDFVRIVQVAGGLFVLWLAWGAWKSLRAGALIGAVSSDAPVSLRQVLTRAVMMNFLSPGPYVFWGTVNGPLLLEGLRESIWHGIAFLVAFYGSFLGVLVALMLLIDRLRNMGARANRALLAGTALLLTIFGVTLFWQGIGL